MLNLGNGSETMENKKLGIEWLYYLESPFQVVYLKKMKTVQDNVENH